MRLTKIALAVMLMPVATSVSAYDAKTVGQGGAGVALGDYTTFMTNPAHLAEFDNDDDFGVSLGFGALLQDKDDLVDAADKASDAVNALESTPDTSTKALATASLEALAGKYLRVSAGGSGYVAIPNSVMPASLFVNAGLKMAAGIDEIDLGDLNDINNAGGSFDADSLNTEMAASAIMTTEVGIATAQTLETSLPGQLNVGGAIKHQTITLIDYQETVSNFDSDKLLDSESEDSNINLDLGVSYQHNDMLSFGLTGKNLISKTYKSKNTGAEYKVEPQVTAGFGVQYGIASLVADTQLTKNGGYGAVAETQYASLGVTVDFWEHAKFSAGYRTDLENNDVNVLTAGIGISPWDLFGLDIAAMVGEDNAYGGVIRFTAKF